MYYSKSHNCEKEVLLWLHRAFEEKAKLLEFYQSEKNKFRIFGERYSEKDGVKYIQLLKGF